MLDVTDCIVAIWLSSTCANRLQRIATPFSTASGKNSRHVAASRCALRFLFPVLTSGSRSRVGTAQIRVERNLIQRLRAALQVEGSQPPRRKQKREEPEWPFLREGQLRFLALCRSTTAYNPLPPGCWASTTAMEAMFTISRTEAPSCRMCTGLRMPIKIGPITSAPPISWITL
ncbi:hypothetical protein SAMN06269173_103591 [Hymenobacter mucosus]|uniref:Uncharacterized protein n=1 Tax=Hymenobacter mucosus TaxID=1411120 RepID=A0A238X9C7_9BACT|nr:hypothetical protein SAMN06269173_103591 [Hymenobacter mucosus]